MNRITAPAPSSRCDGTVPPYRLLAPSAHHAPVVFTSAHSGRDYPSHFLEDARLDATALRRSEDTFVDELFEAAPRLGAPLLMATFPRVWCDANREAWELDPAMFADPLPDYVNIGSPRVAAGLGTIARVVSVNEPIYRRKLTFADAEARIRTCWIPFHEQLRRLIDATVECFGFCILVDCHSMPSLAAASVPGPPDLVLGDVFGTACAPTVTERTHEILSEARFVVRRNDPYAGGFITRHYGSANGPVHAIQIEINRALYMDEGNLQRLPAFAQVRDRIDGCVAALLATDWETPLAQKKGRP